ncbi:nucleotidyltransferase domain-containing protein [Exiguobacterium algae]|uniref:nucleotidyltransferase domain-containing protein n=1 Tax=Exiguobacterium algae TaxID=2751250 RepID=UPI001BEC5540|nr:nucleotidyltransferase domain-containing protein [Exiguobacterium algae]
MKQPTRLGTDQAGYVINPTSRDSIQPDFKSVLSKTINLLNGVFGDNLHSVYLYGSIGRGTAVVGRSDLDLTVLVHEDVDTTELMEQTERLLKEHREVIKIDYDIGRVDTALDPNKRFEWGFWLRHLCTCIYGEDLSTRFPLMKPDVHVSQALNQDFPIRLVAVREQLKSGTISYIEKRSMVKRVIRAWYLTINARDESFAMTIEEQMEILRLYFPKDDRIHRLEELIYREEMTNRELLEVLNEIDWT